MHDLNPPHSPELPPGQQLAAKGKWPFVGEREPGPGAAPWTVAVGGRVDIERRWTLDELQQLPLVERLMDIHCVTRWSQLGLRFGGVRLSDVLAMSQPAADASFISFVARSHRDHSTSLPLAVALELETIIAFRVDGQPLALEHGGPARVIVPNRYFFKSLKWLARIDLLPADRLGYWEHEAGYHNVADPWREERYVASGLSKTESQRLIASRDFSGRNLLSLEAADRDLAGLNARGALLRNADFRRCDLRGACFDEANLSNAHLGGADLRGATFQGADVEGADFSGADLRGSNFQAASLFGASFTTQPASGAAARLDEATLIDPAALDQLTPVQADFVRRNLSPNS